MGAMCAGIATVAGGAPVGKAARLDGNRTVGANAAVVHNVALSAISAITRRAIATLVLPAVSRRRILIFSVKSKLDTRVGGRSSTKTRRARGAKKLVTWGRDGVASDDALRSRLWAKVGAMSGPGRSQTFKNQT